MIKKICEICGKEFWGRKENKYCSRKCYYQSRIKKLEKVCPICGRKFITRPFRLKNGKGLYCSNKCVNVANHKYNDIEIKDTHAEIIIISKKFGEVRALIDIEDVEKCKHHTWSLNYCKPLDSFYAITSFSLGKKKRKTVPLHRFIMGFPEDKSIDHINHNTLDDRKQNLKVCTHFENMQNKKVKATSGYVGVSYYPKRNRWVAKITVKRKTINLGTFDNLEDAIEARKEGEQKYFGV